jgi:hypothetical protein
MNRLFGQSKGSAVPKPTLNDTAATLDSRVETLNKQISSIDQGLFSLFPLTFILFFSL